MLSLAKQEKQTLLGLARRSMETRVRGESWSIQVVGEEGLLQPAGAFVSLHAQDQLRGCIGQIEAVDPVFRVVQEMAVAAALRDPRFPPVRAEELGALTLEVSVLSPPEPLPDLGALRIGRDGLIVSAGAYRGLLLPQVATDYAWDAETFLSHTCQKAGLPLDYWRSGKARIEYFSAEVFSEGEFKR